LIATLMESESEDKGVPFGGMLGPMPPPLISQISARRFSGRSNTGQEFSDGFGVKTGAVEEAKS
jgi:hypothetical protein